MATPAEAQGWSSSRRGWPRTVPVARKPRAKSRASPSAASGLSGACGRRSTSAMRHTCPGTTCGSAGGAVRAPSCRPACGASHETRMRRGTPGRPGPACSAVKRTPRTSASGSSATRSTSRATASWCSSASASSRRHCARTMALSAPASSPAAKTASTPAAPLRQRRATHANSRQAAPATRRNAVPGNTARLCTAPAPATMARQNMRPLISVSQETDQRRTRRPPGMGQ